MHKIAYLYPLILFLYSIFSYTQVDPNLVLSSNYNFWDFQQAMWQIGYHNRPLSTLIYIIIIVSLYAAYYFIQQIKLSKKQIITLITASIIALLPSYPALSHDIFNYIFNAKMVMTYHADPHVQVALDFLQDPWLKFMHNIHTPAPYGYGWTALSLIPYLIGGGYLQAEMLIFRLLMILFFLGCLFLYKRIDTNTNLSSLVPLMFNPLILIEIISNIHNDVTMMFFALLAIWLWKSKKIIPALIMLLMSASIKYATIILLLVPLLSFIRKKFHWGDVSASLMLTPLVTARSQRFLPWYLSWSLFLLPLIRNQLLKNTLISASFAGLASYGLILYYGEYTPSLLQQRSLILFSIPIIYAVFKGLYAKRSHHR